MHGCLRGAGREPQGREAGKEGGGVASSAASRCPSSAYWREEEGDRGGSGGGLGRAGPVVAPGKWLEELAQVGFSLSFF